MRESNRSRKIHEEIGKRFLKGIAASPGIVIAKAHVFQDILLLVERRNLEEAHAEQEVTHLKQAIRQVNPAVLRLIQNVVRAAKDAGKQVTLCGEMGGTPAYIPLLVGIGLTDLSINPSALLEAKKTIRKATFEHWQLVAKVALDLASVEEINGFITLENDRIGLQS